MGEEDADAAGSETLERHQGLEHEGGGVFVAAGKEGGQRVDDEQIEFADVLDAREMVDEVEPVFVGGFAAEGTAEPGDVVAERPFVGAKTPLLVAFLAEDDSMAGVKGGVGEVTAGAETVEKDGDERGFAGFPQAGEEGNAAARQVAIPEPGGVAGSVGKQIGAFEGAVCSEEGARVSWRNS
jgi:hypothetical protein